MNKILLFFLVSLFFSGCAIHAMDVKTLTIPPRDYPVTVTVKGSGTCQDFFLFYRITEQVDAQSSDGTQAVRLK